jgi:hypothetical protein
MGKFKHYYLTKIVEDQEWHDKDYIIEEAVFNSLIEFWEEEDGEEYIRQFFENTDPYISDEYRDYYREVHKVLTLAYDWAKIRHSEKEKYNYYSFSDEMLSLNNKIKEADTEHLLNIIKYRKHLWV